MLARLLIVTGLLLFGMAPAALAVGPYPPPPGPVGEVSPGRVEAGACVEFTGSGFSANTVIEIRDNGQPAGTTRTNSRGEFSKTVCYGADAQTGKHVLTASGMTRAGPRSVSVTVFVSGVSQAEVPPGANGPTPVGLARTGVAALALAGIGVAAIALGSGLVLASERRHRRSRRVRRQAVV